MYLVAALANTTTPITDYATGKGFLPVMANQGSTFLIGFNAAGQLKAVQGTINPLDVNGNFLTAPQFGGLCPAGSQTGPGSGTDFCPIGYLIIQCGATANASNGWVFGLNSMSGAVGITYTFQDVCGITDRPQIN
jgi:hypothetical protein